MASENNYTLSELLDLALGTPEIGAVNFNILHRLLHAILTRLDISETRVQVDGFDLVWPILSDAVADHSKRWFNGSWVKVLDGSHGSSMLTHDP